MRPVAHVKGREYPTPMDLPQAASLLTDLERAPERVQLHHGELEGIVSVCMDDIYELVGTGADNDRKMRLVAIEYRARLLLERFKKLRIN